MQDLLSALALVLVIEGIMPFVSPRRLRESLLVILNLSDTSLRGIGLGAMIAGLVLLSVVR